MTNVPEREKKGRRHRQKGTHRARGHVKTEAETGTARLQAKEHLALPEAGRGKEGLISDNKFLLL